MKLPSFQMYIQWNPSYPGSVGPRDARIFETARNFESR